MSTENETPAGVFDLDDWLESGTVARRSVEIYNDPAIMAEYEALERDLTRAESREVDPEASMGDLSEAAVILDRMQALYERWEASRATWTVRALDPSEIQDVHDRFPFPEIPKLLGQKADELDEDAKAERTRAGEEFLKARQAVVDIHNVHLIALAVVEVATSRGTITRVTPGQVERLRTRKPHGVKQAKQLIDAVNEATTGEVDVPRPSSPANSAGGRD